MESILRISEEFSEATDRAAHYALRSDEENFDKALEESQKLFALYQDLGHMVGDIPTRRSNYSRWSESYEKFRAQHNLDQPSNVRINLEGVQAREENLQGVQEAVLTAIRQASFVNGTEKEFDAYTRAMAGHDVHTGDRQTDDTQGSTKTGSASSGADAGRRSSGGGAYRAHRKTRTAAPVDEQEPQDDGTSRFDRRHAERAAQRSNYGAYRQDPDEVRTVSSSYVYDEYGMTYKDYKKARKSKNRDSAGVQSARIRSSMKKNRNSGLFNRVEETSGLDKLGFFRVTYRPHVGPFVLNFGRRGMSSVSLKAGPLRYILWDRGGAHPRFSSANLFTGLSFSGKRTKR